MPWTIADEPMAPPVRECSVCPAYVVKCAHLDGDERVVWLMDDEAWMGTPCVARHDADRARWGVIFDAPQLRHGDICVHPCFNSAVLNVATRAEADAAFERFEAILLGRESAE